MRIGIIGAGNIGCTLAKKFSAAGHGVMLANSRGPESIKELASNLGAVAVTVHDAVKDVDALIIAIPEDRIPQLPKGLLANIPPHFPVVDTGNYYPGVRDEVIPEIDAGLVESQWVELQLGCPVIKVFNNIMSVSLAEKGRVQGDPERIALPVSGDDSEAKQTMIQLVNDAGLMVWMQVVS